jgi:hypothetical protein
LITVFTAEAATKATDEEPRYAARDDSGVRSTVPSSTAIEVSDCPCAPAASEPNRERRRWQTLPVHMIRLTETQSITPYKSHYPSEER